jgi:hypothetical protein
MTDEAANVARLLKGWIREALATFCSLLVGSRTGTMTRVLVSLSFA